MQHQVGLLSAKQVAQRLGIDLARAYELARQNLLPGTVRLGRQVRFCPEKLEKFIEDGGKTLDGGWRRQPE